MKREVISEAVGNIADKHIEEAFEGTVPVEKQAQESAEKVVRMSAKKKKTTLSWRKYLPVVAGISLLVVGVGGFAAFKVAHPWGFKVVTLEGEPGASQPLTEVYRLPHWEERPIYDQYSSVEWNGMDYGAQSGEIPAERIGELLGEVQAVGYDHYAEDAEAERRINAKIYSVTELSEECVLAVQYEGTDIWYAFRNAFYRPETLGQFINDMNMYEDVVFDTVHYSYDNVFGQYVSVRFDDIDDSVVHQWLLSNLDAVNTYDETLLHMEPRRILGISVDIPILGIENISLEVCEGGYIKTNIMATGKLFYIGEENTQGFVDYVLNECDGYETIYIYEDSGIIDSLFGGEPEAYSPEEAASPSRASAGSGE